MKELGKLLVWAAVKTVHFPLHLAEGVNVALARL